MAIMERVLMVVVMTLLFMEDIKITSLVNAQADQKLGAVHAWCTNYTNLTELQTPRGALHPCNVCETTRSTYCFEDLSLHRIHYDRANITQCGSFYVYQLPQFICIKNITLWKYYIISIHKPDTACNDNTNGKLWVQV